MTVGGLLGVNQSLDQTFLDLWNAMLDLLGSVVATLLGTSALGLTSGAGAPIERLWPSLLEVALIIAAVLFVVQVVRAAIQPRLHAVRTVVGPVQFALAVVVTLVATGLVLGITDAVTALVLREGAHVDNTAAAVGRLGIGASVQGVRPVALGLVGMVVVLPVSVVLAVEMIFRSAAILVLVATAPLTAAGLVSAVTHPWFGRAMRWLLAAILIKPAVALMLAVGIAVVTDTHPVAAVDGGRTGLTTVLIGLSVLLVALGSPLALFRLLAAVEPGTVSHDRFREAVRDARAGFGRGVAGAVPTTDVGSVLSSAVSGRWSPDGPEPDEDPHGGARSRVGDVGDDTRGGVVEPGPARSPGSTAPSTRETPHEARWGDVADPAEHPDGSGWRRGDDRGLSGVIR